MSAVMANRRPEAEIGSVVVEVLRQQEEAKVHSRARLANVLIACQNLMARTE